MVHRRLDEFFSQPEANPPEVEPPPASDPKLRVYMVSKRLYYLFSCITHIFCVRIMLILFGKVK
jgi:hypothetical protein